jgi:glycosyltransferase involved in cell wall biosynthesis
MGARLMDTVSPNSAALTSDWGPDGLKEWIDFAHAIAEWCLRNAKKSIGRGAVEDSLQWNKLAGLVLTLGCDPLVSEELEENLLRIARSLPAYNWSAPQIRDGRKRWLHVMDKAVLGGHTAMAWRWMANDAGANIHSMVLLSQEAPVPESLAGAVRRSGGNITTADVGASLLSRAIWLRKLALETADYVVLHGDNSSVMAPVAFGLDGGPPVLLVNHSAHLYWTGGSIADLVLNCRGSKLETEWTVAYRGIPRCATLPIPLTSPERHDADSIFSPEERASAKRELGLPSDAIVLLTIGAAFKYLPIPGLSFFEAAHSILSSCRQAHLLVVGPSESADWRALSESVGGRVRVMGRQFNLRPYHAVADLYLEGFPFGSTTALLEAGSHGIPVVLAPATCPPPFGTDGIALDSVLIRTANVRDYVDRVIALIGDAAERERCGRVVAQSIAEHHLCPGWSRHLSAVVDRLPFAHSVLMPKPKSPPKASVYFWTNFVSTWTTVIGRYRGDILEYPFRLGIEYGVKPMVDMRLYKACRTAKRVRSEGGAPLLLYILLGFVVPVLPRSASLFLYDFLVAVLRANGKVRRTLRALLPLPFLTGVVRKQKSGERYASLTSKG